MERDLHILVNTKDHLVIESPAETLNTPNLVMIAVVLIGLGYVCRKLWAVSRLSVAGILLVVLVVSAFVFADRGTSYRMEMDRTQNLLVMTTYSGKDRADPLSRTTDPLDAFERADMEFDRDFRRITLSTHDGQQVHPLGSDFEIMDSQFRALGAMQAFLKQTPGLEH